jgi:hypothetical protein
MASERPTVQGGQINITIFTPDKTDVSVDARSQREEQH